VDVELYQPTQILRESSNSFIFAVTAEQVMYGVCVYVNEFIDLPPMICGVQQAEDEKDGGNNSGKPPVQWTLDPQYQSDVYATRCYCLVSRFPFFQLHFDFLYSFLNLHRFLWRSKMLEHNQGLAELALSLSASGGDPLLTPRGSILEGSKSPKMEWTTKQLGELLRGYAQMGAPGIDESVHFSLPGAPESFEFFLPSGNPDELVGSWCLPTLCRHLSIDNFFLLFAALCQEKSIVVFCRNLGILSHAVLALIPLLRPNVWAGTFVPLLPPFFGEILDSPVPYIVGVTRYGLQQREACQNSGTVVVELLEDKITAYSPISPAPIEEIKEKARLAYSVLHQDQPPSVFAGRCPVNYLRMLLKEFHNEVLHDFSMALREVQKTSSGSSLSLGSDSPSIVWNRDLLLQLSHSRLLTRRKEYRSFYTKVLRSQMLLARQTELEEMAAFRPVSVTTNVLNRLEKQAETIHTRALAMKDFENFVSLKAADPALVSNPTEHSLGMSK
jgi:hypothetical protein